MRKFTGVTPPFQLGFNSPRNIPSVRLFPFKAHDLEQKRRFIQIALDESGSFSKREKQEAQNF
jgi:hypothetical protein